MFPTTVGLAVIGIRSMAIMSRSSISESVLNEGRIIILGDYTANLAKVLSISSKEVIQKEAAT